ncbi:GIY-YIG nuclease family protein [Sphingopyxis sp. MWB1]|uniref:GIY-YIG nuclease family protein n=1 Tax=Sphingopyxis sp. MWB1 TaxID=1537715 RepID=UPI001185D1B3|nr:hypothetical protein [Sphingopyxis sp. MWB1]
MASEIVAKRLLDNLLPIAEIPIQYGAGVYALCLRGDAEVPGILAGQQGLLYIGMTANDLSVRNHLSYRDSSRSSPRRSLGALLRQKLALSPIARGSGRSKRDFTHFRFTEDGEKRLTEWMGDNLLASQVSVVDNTRMVEEELISQLKPCLNLTKLGGWKNPQRARVSHARSECAALAEGAWLADRR